MRPIQKTINIAAASANGVALSQAPVNNVNVTLNGSFVSGGVATLPYPAPVTLTSTTDLSATTFTVYGLDANNINVTESIVGPNNNTVTTTTVFTNVKAINVSTAVTYTTQRVTVGSAAVGIGTGAWWPLDIYTPNQVTNISCNILNSGTATYSVEYTNEDPFDTSITQLAVVHPVAALTSASTDQTAFTTTLMRAVRVNIASGAGQLRVTVVQQSTK